MTLPSVKLLLRLLVLGLFATTAAAERMVLEVIELEHRLARDVLPLIQPVLAPDATATGTSNRLIIRSTPGNLAEIRAVIGAIDTRIKQLRITVTQDAGVVVQAQQDALSGHLHAGDFTAGAADPGPAAGAGIEIDTPEGSVAYRTHRTHSNHDASNLHFVMTMEGQPAFIATGQQIPQPYYESTLTPYGGGVAGGIDYQAVSSGVYVTPRVQGDRVILDIAPQLERADPRGSGVIDTRGLETTVSGRLGEWIALGGANLASGGTDTELLARTRRRGDNSYSVWVRVEEQP